MNEILKRYAKEHNVFLWEIADSWGMNDGNFSRKLRFPLSEEEAQRFKEIVDEIERAKHERQNIG